MAIRVFLGIAEGGMMPGIAYFLSTVSPMFALVSRRGGVSSRPF